MDMPSEPMLPIVAMFFLLLVQLGLARRTLPAQSLLLGAQAIFWFLAFVLRPLYFVVYQPTTTPELADPRLMWTQYSDALSEVMWLCVAGQAVFVVTAFFIYKVSGASGKRARDGLTPPLRYDWDPTVAGIATVLWLIGWVGRIAMSVGIQSLDSAFKIFGTVGGALLIVSYRGKSKRLTVAILCALILIEEVWAFSFASKAALVVPLLALALRWMLTERPGVIGRRVTALGLTALVGFLVIQPLHGVNTAQTVSASNTDEFAEVKGSAISVLERFDGLSAVTDAVFMGPATWMTLDQFLHRVLVNAVPTGPIEAKSASTGQQWTREVRAESNPNQYLDVSLAAGPTAEGYALAGMLGVAFENALLAAATMAAGSGIHSRRPHFVVFASTFAFSTILFEQGLFGLSATTNKALQLTICAYLLAVILRSSRTRDELQPPEKRRENLNSSHVRGPN